MGGVETLPVNGHSGQSGANSETDPELGRFLFSTYRKGVWTMNVKIVVLFLVGATIALSAILFGGFATPYMRGQESAETSDITSGVDGEYFSDLIAALQQVRSEIQSPETLEFYNKLLAEYAIEEIYLQTAEDDQIILPDMNKIQWAALTLPLYEAGKNITDKGLKEFYCSFLEDTGLLMPMPAEGTQ